MSVAGSVLLGFGFRARSGEQKTRQAPTAECLGRPRGMRPTPPPVENTRLLTIGVIVLTLDGMFAELLDTIYCWAVRPQSGYEHCTTPTTSTSTANHIEPLGFQSHWTDLFDFIHNTCSQRWCKALWRWVSDMARCRIYVSSLCMSTRLVGNSGGCISRCFQRLEAVEAVVCPCSWK